MTPSEKHNRLAPELLTRLLTECPSEAEALVVLESLVLGVMLRFRPNPRHAGEILDTLMPHVFKAELFAREAWEDNDTWGNQADKFNQERASA